MEPNAKARTVFRVFVPNAWSAELDYALRVVLSDWLGLMFDTHVGSSDRISLAAWGRALEIDASFFVGSVKQWLHERSLPHLPLRELELDALPGPIRSRLRERMSAEMTAIPVLYGIPQVTDQFSFSETARPRREEATKKRHIVQCDVDIFGSIFFMLSRYEEAVLPDRDQHDRFPGTASIAYRAGFLQRPIVNEYVELLWAMISYLWPGLERTSRQFRTVLSHDVDSPFAYVGLAARSILRRMAGDVLKRGRPFQAPKTFAAWRAANRRDVSEDPHNTFDFVMTESERRGLQSAFYFIPDHSAGAIDGRYHLDDPEIVDLLRKIDGRGHEIGLHTSYNTYRDEGQTVREATTLRYALQRHGIGQEIAGGRQHYLRWSTPETWRNWESARMSYDTTLGFADQVGFRSGTCWDYQPYDVEERRPLNLLERPLVVMEGSLLSPQYMNVDYTAETYELLVDLKYKTKQYGGHFTLLWHNNRLVEERDRNLYLAVVDA